MRYLCFVKMDESEANPPQALMDAMGEHVGDGLARRLASSTAAVCTAPRTPSSSAYAAAT